MSALMYPPLDISRPPDRVQKRALDKRNGYNPPSKKGD